LKREKYCSSLGRKLKSGMKGSDASGFGIAIKEAKI
jgi:hypothetical protein